MTNTYVAHQTNHMAATENIACQTLALALVKFTIGLGNNTGGILTTVLQHGQGVIKP